MITIIISLLIILFAISVFLQHQAGGYMKSRIEQTKDSFVFFLLLVLNLLAIVILGLLAQYFIQYSINNLW